MPNLRFDPGKARVKWSRGHVLLHAGDLVNRFSIDK